MTGAAIPDQSGAGSDGNEEVLYTIQKLQILSFTDIAKK